jgi:ribonuclease Z
MHVTFLGTSGAVPTTARNPSSLLVRREGERFLFDAGEGTQRQMMRFSTGFNVSHLFVTHIHGDHVLGIPGLVQTWDFNDREDPLAIHVPAGTRGEIRDLVTAAGASPSYPVRINEVAPGDTALDREDFAIRAFEVDHRTTAVGYALVEDDRKGRFDRQKAEEELGIPPGPAYGKLHGGEPVELDDGRVIQPDQVVGPPRPGRTVVYTGDTRPVDSTVEAATDADLLVHDATFAEDRAERAGQTGHSTARQAAEIANRAGAKRLALTHISTRYAGQADRLAEEARAVFGGEAFVPDDGDELDVPFPDANDDADTGDDATVD